MQQILHALALRVLRSSSLWAVVRRRVASLASAPSLAVFSVRKAAFATRWGPSPPCGQSQDSFGQSSQTAFCSKRYVQISHQPARCYWPPARVSHPQAAQKASCSKTHSNGTVNRHTIQKGCIGPPICPLTSLWRVSSIRECLAAVRPVSHSWIRMQLHSKVLHESQSHCAWMILSSCFCFVCNA